MIGVGGKWERNGGKESIIGVVRAEVLRTLI